MVVLEKNMAANFAIMDLLKTGNKLFDVLIACLFPVFLTFLVSKFQMVFERLKQYIIYHRETQRVIHYEHILNKYGHKIVNDKYIKNDILQKAIIMYIGAHSSQNQQHAHIDLMAVQNHSNIDSEYLQRYRIICSPIEQRWINVNDHIQIYIERKRSHDNNEYGTVENKFTLRSKVSSNDIDTFVNDAYNWYIQELHSHELHSRYYYNPFYARKPQELRYTRYKLTDNKTFDNIFFPQKQFLINVLNDFQQKKGKYAIKGYPNKIGFMFYGLPGTGKTSTIKAIASMLNRNIVNVPLSTIQTNSQFIEIMHNTIYEVKNEDIPVKMTSKDSIFVIEDIDCIHDIVKQRELIKSENVTKKKKSNKEGESDDDESSNIFIEDSLSLSVILNTLDGIIDTPDRVLIITTNHPEKLDDAIIRPGRIDHKIEFTKMSQADKISMLEYYYQTTLTLEQKNQIYRNSRTAAELECMISNSTLDQVLLHC